MILLRVTSGLGVLFSCLFLISLAAGQEDQSLESQLVRMQSQSGQLIIQLRGQSIDALLFGEKDLVSLPFPKALDLSIGAISQDGEEIAFRQVIPTVKKDSNYSGAAGIESILSIALTSGEDLRQFPQIKEPTEFCWSRDRQHLAFVSNIGAEPATVTGHELQVMSLNSGKVTPIDSTASISSQCWNGSGTSLVFEKGSSIRVFDIQNATTSFLGPGDKATWSPDGRSVAIRKGDAYYTISPSGSGEKLLFKRKNALSPLWWSSDSDMVFFVAQPSIWKSSWHILDELDLCVVRLADRKETVVYRFSGKGRPLVFQWVENSMLVSKAKATSQR